MKLQAGSVAKRSGEAAARGESLIACREALLGAEDYLTQAQEALRRRVANGGPLDPKRLDREQFAAHAFAWIATYVAALGELLDWAERLEAAGQLGELETLILEAGFGEYLNQLAGGIALSQVEVARPADLGLEEAAALSPLESLSALSLRRNGNAAPTRMRIAELLIEGLDGGRFGASGLDDETLEAMRDQMRRFADSKVDEAQVWHRADRLIPDATLKEVAELGVFGLTIAEGYGGLGLGKLAMCVVTEELSRGALALGSLGTRAEIAGELIAQGGTEEQKRRWLPGIASGEILPTAVFTEPNVGSDLGSLKTRAVKDGAVYRIHGNKTWITHAARSDVMTLLARTGTPDSGWRGLSMFLAEKPRGSEAEPFPAPGMSGGEIKVLGYRGMKEYEIAFDGFEVAAGNLLGGVEGEGFKQLMATFESARIQTAARAVGVAENALELGLRYAVERRQFGRRIAEFPRVAGKLAWMAVETTIARQLSYRAARAKDSGRRCDIEAGMAKLLGARVAWANADNALQIHGGNGYAEEFPVSRLLVDARILNIFEGAAEIQAQVIAKGLLQQRNA